MEKEHPIGFLFESLVDPSVIVPFAICRNPNAYYEIIRQSEHTYSKYILIAKLKRKWWFAKKVKLFTGDMHDCNKLLKLLHCEQNVLQDAEVPAEVSQTKQENEGSWSVLTWWEPKH